MELLAFAALFGVFMVVFHAGLMKLAARLYKRAQITWRQGFYFGALLYLVAVVNRMLDTKAPAFAESAMSLLVTMVAIAAISVWYFAPRARTSSGNALGWKGAAVLAAIYGGLLLAFLAVVMVGYTMISDAS